MAMSGVLHRELVQTELRAHFLELGGLGILESYPDEAVGTLEILADVFLGDLGELPALLVRDTIDKHDGDSPCVVARIIAARARARHHASTKSACGLCYTDNRPMVSRSPGELRVSRVLVPSSDSASSAVAAPHELLLLLTLATVQF